MLCDCAEPRRFIATLCATMFLGCAFAPTAYAQSNVSIYGSIDEGITYTSNALGKRTATVAPAAVPDFIGLRGSEDLGDHATAFYAMQQGYRSNNGQAIVPGSAYGFFSYVGLSHPQYGTVYLGRQLDLAAEALRVNSNGSNLLSFYFFHPANLDNLGILGDSINNSVRYTSPSLFGLQASVIYGLEESGIQPGRILSMDVVHDEGAARFSLVYSSWRDHAVPLVSGLGRAEFLGQSLVQGATFVAKRQDIFGLSTYYTASPSVALHAVLSQVNLASSARTTRMRNVEVGVNLRMASNQTVALGGHASWLDGTRYLQAGVGDLLTASKRTTLYAQVVYQHADGSANAAIPLLLPSTSRSQLALRVGVHQFF